MDRHFIKTYSRKQPVTIFKSSACLVSKHPDPTKHFHVRESRLNDKTLEVNQFEDLFDAVATGVVVPSSNNLFNDSDSNHSNDSNNDCFFKKPFDPINTEEKTKENCSSNNNTSTLKRKRQRNESNDKDNDSNLRTNESQYSLGSDKIKNIKDTQKNLSKKQKISSESLQILLETDRLSVEKFNTNENLEKNQTITAENKQIESLVLDNKNDLSVIKKLDNLSKIKTVEPLKTLENFPTSTPRDHKFRMIFNIQNISPINLNKELKSKKDEQIKHLSLIEVSKKLSQNNVLNDLSLNQNEVDAVQIMSERFTHGSNLKDNQYSSENNSCTHDTNETKEKESDILEEVKDTSEKSSKENNISHLSVINKSLRNDNNLSKDISVMQPNTNNDLSNVTPLFNIKNYQITSYNESPILFDDTNDYQNQIQKSTLSLEKESKDSDIILKVTKDKIDDLNNINLVNQIRDTQNFDSMKNESSFYPQEWTNDYNSSYEYGVETRKSKNNTDTESDDVNMTLDVNSQINKNCDEQNSDFCKTKHVENIIICNSETDVNIESNIEDNPEIPFISPKCVNKDINYSNASQKNHNECQALSNTSNLNADDICSTKTNFQENTRDVTISKKFISKDFNKFNEDKIVVENVLNVAKTKVNADTNDQTDTYSTGVSYNHNQETDKRLNGQKLVIWIPKIDDNISDNISPILTSTKRIKSTKRGKKKLNNIGKNNVDITEIENNKNVILYENIETREQIHLNNSSNSLQSNNIIESTTHEVSNTKQKIDKSQEIANNINNQHLIVDIPKLSEIETPKTFNKTKEIPKRRGKNTNINKNNNNSKDKNTSTDFDKKKKNDAISQKNQNKFNINNDLVENKIDDRKLQVKDCFVLVKKLNSSILRTHLSTLSKNEKTETKRGILKKVKISDVTNSKDIKLFKNKNISIAEDSDKINFGNEEILHINNKEIGLNISNEHMSVFHAKLNDPLKLTMRRKTLKKWDRNMAVINEDQLEQSTSGNETDKLAIMKHDNHNIQKSTNNHSVIELVDDFNTQPIFLKPGKSWARSLSIINHFQNKQNLEELSVGRGKNWRYSVQKILSMQPEVNIQNIARKTIAETEFESRNSTKRDVLRVELNRVSVNVTSPPRFSRCSMRIIPGDKRSTLTDDFLQSESNSFISSRTRKTSVSRKTSLKIRRDTIIETEDDLIKSAKDIILKRCKQTSYLSFDSCFTDSFIDNCRKIGEGVYGEVFLYSSGLEKSVIKIIPIEGDQLVNSEPQKKFHEILSEIIIAEELHNLKFGYSNKTNGFVGVNRIMCVMGKYPDKLIDLWDIYDEEKQSENDSPSMFNNKQLFIILELAHAGQDLEAFVFQNASESFSVFLQTAFTLAVAEQSLEFEHRDLHWGNILISKTNDISSTYVIDGDEFSIPTKGIKATVIDFTLSRMSYQGCKIFNDLATDPALFTAQGEYQFDIYRLMRDNVNNDWQRFNPFTNVLWMDYLLDKLITAVKYKKKTTKIHKLAINKMKELRKEILNYKSAFDFINNCKKIVSIVEKEQ